MLTQKLPKTSKCCSVAEKIILKQGNVAQMLSQKLLKQENVAQMLTHKVLKRENVVQPLTGQTIIKGCGAQKLTEKNYANKEMVLECWPKKHSNG